MVRIKLGCSAYSWGVSECKGTGLMICGSHEVVKLWVPAHLVRMGGVGVFTVVGRVGNENPTRSLKLLPLMNHERYLSYEDFCMHNIY